MTFEQRAAEINADGWLLNNCFQLRSGEWRVSVRTPNGEHTSAFASGTSPLDALERAMKTVPEEALLPKAESLEDLLG